MKKKNDPLGDKQSWRDWRWTGHGEGAESFEANNKKGEKIKANKLGLQGLFIPGR
jgi:hypothetical protein